MKSRYSKWLKGGLLGALALVGLSACTDDHFDLSSGTATTTLWQKIVAHPELDSLRQILEKVTVTKDELDTKSKQKYSALLNSSQTFTLWAPLDGTYNAAHWLDLIEKGQEKVVEKQFVANHLARYDYSGVFGDSVRIKTLNAKVTGYSASLRLFHGMPMTGESETAGNGTLHFLQGPAPYKSNLYESIEFTANLDSLYNFLHADDTLEFNQDRSVEGATVNGEIQYVDSVFERNNKIVRNLGLWKNEDSLLLAIVPTNTAWREAKEKISKYYRYKSVYPYRKGTSSTTLYNYLNVDSMADAKIKNVLLGNIVESLAKQPGYNVSNTSVDYLKNFLAHADSLKREGTLAKPHVYQPELSKIFEGVEPYEVSNGYVYPIEHYNFPATKYWHTAIRVEAEATNRQNIFSITGTKQQGSSFGTTTIVNSLNRNDSVVGNVSGNTFVKFEPKSTGDQPFVSYELPNVRSGKYDIYIVMVPSNMDKKKIPVDQTKPSQFSVDITYDFKKTNFGNNEIKKSFPPKEGSKKVYFHSRPGMVDTILIAKDFEFPYAFDGIADAAPFIDIKTYVKTSADKKKYDPSLYIDCFLLIPRDDDALDGKNDEE